MKRLIVAGVLIVVISIIHFGGNMYIKNVIKESKNMLEECIDEYKSGENSEAAAEKLKNYWGEKEDFLSVFAHHDNIDEIELAINSLTVYSKIKDTEIFYEYSGTVETLLHQLLEDNSFNMHSIL